MIKNKPVKIASKEHFDKEMKQASLLFAKKETDETWEQFAVALKNLAHWTLEDNVHQYDSFVGHIKSLQLPIIRALKTERTRLSGSATDLLRGLSQAMQREYEPLHTLFSPALIEMFGRTNKVLLKRAVDCYKTAIENSKMPKLIPRLCTILRAGKEPNNSVRQCVAECITKMIQANTEEDVLHFKTHIEGAIVNAAMDKSKEVRQSVQQCYQTYCKKLPGESTRFNATLKPDAKKYLQAQIRPAPAKRAPTLSKMPTASRPIRASMPSLPTPVTHRTKAPEYTLPKPRPSLPATSLLKRPSVAPTQLRSDNRLAIVGAKAPSSPAVVTKEPSSPILDTALAPVPEKERPLSEPVPLSPPKVTSQSPTVSTPKRAETESEPVPTIEPVEPLQISASSSSLLQSSKVESTEPKCSPSPPSSETRQEPVAVKVPKEPITSQVSAQKPAQPLAPSLGRNFKYFSRFNHLKPTPGTRLPKVNKPCMLSGAPVRPVKRKHPQGEENVQPVEDNRHRKRQFRS